MALVKLTRIADAAGMLPSLQEYESLLDKVAQRAYEIFDARGHAHGQDLDDWFTAEGQVLGTALAAVEDVGDGVRVRVSLPGFKANSVTVEVSPEELIIRAENHTRNGKPESKVMRRVRFQKRIDVASARASMDEGILSVELPGELPA